TRPRPPPQPRAREDRRKEPSPPPPSRGVNEEAEINRFGNPPTDSVRSDTALNRQRAAPRDQYGPCQAAEPVPERNGLLQQHEDREAGDPIQIHNPPPEEQKRHQ